MAPRWCRTFRAPRALLASRSSAGAARRGRTAKAPTTLAQASWSRIRSGPPEYLIRSGPPEHQIRPGPFQSYAGSTAQGHAVAWPVQGRRCAAHAGATLNAREARLLACTGASGASVRAARTRSLASPLARTSPHPPRMRLQEGMTAAEVSAYNVDVAARFGLELAEAFAGDWHAPFKP